MEWLYPIALKVIAAVALIYFGLGLFNVPWLMRVRILASLGTGVLVVGAAGYVMVKPEDPLGAISLFTGQISIFQAMIFVGLAFAAGGLATLVCYPIGGILGPYAAPAGVAVLALCSGGIKQLLLIKSTFEQRNELYSFFRWESVFWLAICVAGCAGTALMSKLVNAKVVVLGQSSDEKKEKQLVNILAAIVATMIVVYFTIGIFAQDIRQIDPKLGYVVGTPGNGQIAFGVFLSVGLAAFLIKRFLQIHFYAAVVGALLLYIGVLTKIIGSAKLEHMVTTWPIDFFPHAIYAIIPAQFVSFSAIGAMTGYWVSLRLTQQTLEEK